MSDNSSKEIRSTITSEGVLELSIVNVRAAGSRRK